MTRHQATVRAAKLARKNNDVYFVVYEDGEYHVADSYDLDTYFAGLNPILAVDQDGQVEAA